MRGRPHRRGEEFPFDGRAPGVKTLAVEKAVLVQRRRQLDYPLPLYLLSRVAEDGGADVVDRVLAVEERHDLQQGHGQHRHRRREAGGIAQREIALPLVIDGECLDRAQPRAAGDHDLKKRTAEAT
jgi:hypothetical protein